MQGQVKRLAYAIKVSRTHIMQLLGHAGLRRIFADHGGAGVRVTLGDDDDNNLEDGYGGLARRRRRPKSTTSQLPKIPSEEGEKLMESGVFGSNEYYQDVLKKRKTKLARRLMSRELGIKGDYSQRANALISQVSLNCSDAVFQSLAYEVFC